MGTLHLIGGVSGLVIRPSAVPAAPLDGSAPMLCALTSVVECPRSGNCERSTTEEAAVPPFVRINVQQRLLSSVDGGTASAHPTFHRAKRRLTPSGMPT